MANTNDDELWAAVIKHVPGRNLKGVTDCKDEILLSLNDSVVLLTKMKHTEQEEGAIMKEDEHLEFSISLDSGQGVIRDDNLKDKIAEILKRELEQYGVEEIEVELESYFETTKIK